MTLEQQRAALAFQHVQELKTLEDENERNRYGSMAHKLPVLIRTAGLCQALHFIKSRDKMGSNKLLGHLAEQLTRVDPAIVNLETLCSQARGAGLSHYLWLTREALASATWYGRLAQSELGIQRGTEAEEDS